MKYRKKPVVIEAVRARDAIGAAKTHWRELPVWMRDAYDKGGIVFTDRGVSVTTLEGVMLAALDDWIICGIKGELYPCKPDIFEATYEACE